MRVNGMRRFVCALAAAAAVPALAGDVIVTIDYYDEPLAAAHSNGMTRAGIRALAAEYGRIGVKAVAWRVASAGAGSYRSNRLSTMKWIRETPHPVRDARWFTGSWMPKSWPDAYLARSWEKTLDEFDPMEVAAEAFHAEGLEFWLFVDLYDEMYSRFLEEHPECLVKTPGGANYPGVRDYANDTAVREKLKDIAELYRYKPDALYFSTSCHSRHLGFPESDGAFGTLPGEKLTGFLRQLKAECEPHGVKIVMGVSLGKTLDFCSPYFDPHPRYRVEQDWRRWIDEGLVAGLLLGDYEILWPPEDGWWFDYWKLKGLEAHPSPGKLPLDVFLPEIKAYAKGRVKLYLFSGWLNGRMLEQQLKTVSGAVRQYDVDGYFAHESVAIEASKGGFETLRANR